MSDWSSDVCSSDLAATSTRLAPALRSRSCHPPVQPGFRQRALRIDQPRAQLAHARTTGLEFETHPPAAGRGVAIRHRIAQRAVRGGGVDLRLRVIGELRRSEEHTSELQSLMRISYAVFC